jgi:hypothetical protein
MYGGKVDVSPEGVMKILGSESGCTCATHDQVPLMVLDLLPRTQDLNTKKHNIASTYETILRISKGIAQDQRSVS